MPWWDFPVVQCAKRFYTPNPGGSGSIPSQGIRSHATTKTQQRQQQENTYF